MVEPRLHKLQKTKDYIESVKETEAEYRKRRVQCVIERMQEKDEPIRLWQVIREAGIKEKFIGEVKELLTYLGRSRPSSIGG